jgi:hypothetical protein
MWREPCSKERVRGQRINSLAVCQDQILFDKSYQIMSAQMRYAQQIRNSRGGTTSLIPVVKPTIVAPPNKF